MENNTRIDDVKAFWERNLCGHEYIKSEFKVNSKEYFDDGQRIRYKYHYHIPRDIEILSKIKPGGKVLDIGVGIGCDTELLCKKGFEVFGIDLTSRSVESTRARLNFYGLKADIKQGNAEKLDFPDNTFDAVYSFGVLHHTPDTEKAINEVHRVLKPNGIALIMLYNKQSLNYWAHVVTKTQYDGTKNDFCPVERAYTKKQVKRMFQRFSQIKIKPDYLFGTGWGRVNWFAPMIIKKPLGKLIGWHLIIWATK